MQKIFFPSLGDTVAANLFLPENVSNPSGVLFLYGGGRHVTKALFADFQQILCTGGIASLAIDFPGDGESSGEFADGSLAKRLEYAHAAYKELCKYADPEKITVYGGSMGGYIAVKLVEKFPETKSLVLAAAAAYGKATEHIPLGEDFTKALIKKDSWKDSSAFTILKNFQGNVLVLYGENDTVIPQDIKDTYMHIAKGKGESVRISGASHKLLSPTSPEEEKAKEETIRIICDFLTKTGHTRV